MRHIVVRKLCNVENTLIIIFQFSLARPYRIHIEANVLSSAIDSIKPKSYSAINVSQKKRNADADSFYQEKISMIGVWQAPASVHHMNDATNCSGNFIEIIS